MNDRIVIDKMLQTISSMAKCPRMWGDGRETELQLVTALEFLAMEKGFNPLKIRSLYLTSIENAYYLSGKQNWNGGSLYFSIELDKTSDESHLDIIHQNMLQFFAETVLTYMGEELVVL